MELGLRDRVALVTGGTAGIGLETARLFVESGAKVVTLSRGQRVEVGQELHVRADLAEPGKPEQAVRTVERELGRLDILINNVGLAVARRLEDVGDDDWDLSWRTNVLSAVQASRAAIPGMRTRKAGSIVNVASTAGRRPSLNLPDYSVMKAALLAHSGWLADSLATDGIRCNAVIPGPTLTPAWTREGGLAEQQGDPQTVLTKAAAARPLGRFAEPIEIANVIVFLSSPRAGHLNGVEWSVSGGTVP